MTEFRGGLSTWSGSPKASSWPGGWGCLVFVWLRMYGKMLVL